MDQHFGNRMANNDSSQTTTTSSQKSTPKVSTDSVTRRVNTRRRQYRRGRTPPKWLGNNQNDMCGELTMITGPETLRHLRLQRHRRHHRHHRHHLPRHPKGTVSTADTNTTVYTSPSLSSSIFVGATTTPHSQLLRWQESLEPGTTLSFPSIEWDADEINKSQEETLRGGRGGLDNILDRQMYHQFSSSSSSLSYACTMGHHDENDTMKDEEGEEDECYKSLHNLSSGLLDLSIHLTPQNRRRRRHHRHHFLSHHHHFLHRTLAFDSNLSSLGQA